MEFTEDMSTTIKLALAPAECVFVVFSHKAGATPPAETLPAESREGLPSHSRDGVAETRSPNARIWARVLGFPISGQRQRREGSLRPELGTLGRGGCRTGNGAPTL